jgi:hypothetical protein
VTICFYIKHPLQAGYSYNVSDAWPFQCCVKLTCSSVGHPLTLKGFIFSAVFDVPHSIEMLCCICMIIHVCYEIQMLIVPSLVKDCPGLVEPEDPSWWSQKLAIDTNPGNVVMLCSH